MTVGRLAGDRAVTRGWLAGCAGMMTGWSENHRGRLGTGGGPVTASDSRSRIAQWPNRSRLLGGRWPRALPPRPGAYGWRRSRSPRWAWIAEIGPHRSIGGSRSKCRVASVTAWVPRHRCGESADSGAARAITASMTVGARWPAPRPAVADLADHLEAFFGEHFREIHPNQRIVVGDQHPPPRPVGSHRVCGADGMAFFHERSPSTSRNACGARPGRTVMRGVPGGRPREA